MAQEALAKMPFLAKAEGAKQGGRGVIGRGGDGNEAVDAVVRDEMVEDRADGLACIALAMMSGQDAVAELDLAFAWNPEADADVAHQNAIRRALDDILVPGTAGFSVARVLSLHVGDHPGEELPDVGPQARIPGHVRKIGRASCRERVCQYV